MTTHTPEKQLQEAMEERLRWLRQQGLGATPTAMPTPAPSRQPPPRALPSEQAVPPITPFLLGGRSSVEARNLQLRSALEARGQPAVVQLPFNRTLEQENEALERLLRETRPLTPTITPETAPALEMSAIPGRVKQRAEELRGQGMPTREAAEQAYRETDLPDISIPSGLDIPLPGGRRFKDFRLGVKGFLEFINDPMNWGVGTGITPAVGARTALRAATSAAARPRPGLAVAGRAALPTVAERVAPVVARADAGIAVPPTTVPAGSPTAGQAVPEAAVPAPAPAAAPVPAAPTAARVADEAVPQERLAALQKELLELDANISALQETPIVRPQWAGKLSDREVEAVARHEGRNPFVADWADGINPLTVQEAKLGRFKDQAIAGPGGKTEILNSMRYRRSVLRREVGELEAAPSQPALPAGQAVVAPEPPIRPVTEAAAPVPAAAREVAPTTTGPSGSPFAEPSAQERLAALQKELFELDANIKVFEETAIVRPRWAVGLSDQEVEAVARHEGLDPFAPDWHDAIDPLIIREAKRGRFKAVGTETVTSLRSQRVGLRRLVGELEAEALEAEVTAVNAARAAQASERIGIPVGEVLPTVEGVPSGAVVSEAAPTSGVPTGVGGVAVEPAEAYLPELPSLERVIDSNFKSDWYRAIGQRIARLPVIGRMVMEQANPAAVAVTDANKGIISYNTLRDAGETSVTAAMKPVEELRDAFQVDKAARVTNVVIPEGNSPYIGDVLTLPGAYPLNAAQRRYAELTKSLLDKSLAQQRRRGIKIEPIQNWDDAAEQITLAVDHGQGQYFPHVVIGKVVKGEEVMVERGIVSGGFGAKQIREKPRAWASQRAGVEQGQNIYMADPTETLRVTLQSGKQAEAYRMLGAFIHKQPDVSTIVERIRERYPGVILERVAAIQGERAHTRLLDTIKSAIRGESPAGARLRSIRQNLPQMAQKLDDALAITPTAVGVAIKRMPKELFDALRTTKPRFLAALEEARLAKQARAPLGAPSRLGERTITPGDLVGTLARMGADERQSFSMLKRIYEDALSVEQKQAAASVTQRRTALRGILAEAETGFEASKLRVAKAGSAYNRAKIKVQGHITEEGQTVMHPAFQGLIMPREMAQQIAAHLSERVPLPLRRARVATDVLRMLQTGLDPGFVLIQGSIPLFYRPLVWGKAVGITLRSWRDQKVVHLYFQLPEVRAVIDKMVEAGAAPLASSEFVAGAGVLGKIPVGGVAFRRGAELFNTYLDVTRVELHRSLGKLAKNPVELRELTNVIDQMVGMTSTRQLGVTATRRAVEGVGVLYAAQYRRAGLGLIGAIAQGGLRGSIARKSLASFIFGGITFMSALALILGQPERLDPRRGKNGIPQMYDLRYGKFLSVGAGDHEIGIGGVIVSYLRLMGNISRGLSDDGIKGAAAALWRSYRGLTSPFASDIIDLVTGKEAYTGEDTRTLKGLARMAVKDLTPFYVEPFITEPGSSDMTTFLGNLWGTRERALSAAERRGNRRDAWAADSGLRTLGGELVREWSEMNRAQQKDAARQDEELARLGLEVEDDNYRRAGNAVRNRIDVQRAERESYEASMSENATRLRLRTISKKQYDDDRKNIRTLHRGATQVLWAIRELVEGESIKSFEKWVAENQRPEDAALDAYFDKQKEELDKHDVLTSAIWHKVEQRLANWLSTTYGSQIRSYVLVNKSMWILDLPDEAREMEQVRQRGIGNRSWWKNYRGTR